MARPGQAAGRCAPGQLSWLVWLLSNVVTLRPSPLLLPLLLLLIDAAAAAEAAAAAAHFAARYTTRPAALLLAAVAVRLVL